MNSISPKYQMNLIDDVEKSIWATYSSYNKVRLYINKWHETGDEWLSSWQNFTIVNKQNGDIDLLHTLHTMDGQTLLKIAIDLGVDTPDFIPSIPTFRNEIKSSYETASATFEKAFRQIEEHPDTAIGLANSALESIIKEILKDERLNSKISGKETLYELSTIILKEFGIYPSSNMPKEINTIGSSLLAINNSIEKIRSEKTNFHGKTSTDYVVTDTIYTYFIVNSVTTVGLFLSSYYKTKFPSKPKIVDDGKELPF